MSIAEELGIRPAQRTSLWARRMPLAAALLCLLMVLLWSTGRARTPGPAEGAAPYGLEQDRAGFRASNPTQGFTEAFTPAGAVIQTGHMRLGLRLDGVGGSGLLRALATSAPQLASGRVLYRHGSLSEWYANGPAGLEQGFTLERAPSRGGDRTLALSLSISGNAEAALARDQESVIFTHAGTGALVYGGLRARDARGHELHSRLELASGHIRLLIATTPTSYPVHIDPLLAQGGKLTGPSAGVDFFGSSVALSSDGSTALVSAPLEGADSGAVWVFVRSGSSWVQQGPKLTNPGPGGFFGSSVALSADGNTALIGARGNGGPGSAFLFTREGGVWSSRSPALSSPEGNAGDEFGASVALAGSGEEALIGAAGENHGAGGAFVFSLHAGTWAPDGAEITGAGESGTSRFGEDVALSSDGQTALVGGPGDSGANGAAWVFSRATGSWPQQGAKLTGSGVPAGGQFGWRVALSADGNTALETDNSTDGAAWAFTRTGETWAQQGSPFTDSEESGEGYFFGSGGAALSADGNTAVIGAPNDATVGGAVWRFTRSGSTWQQQGDKIVAPEEVGQGGFGGAIVLSSDARTALIGGAQDNHSVGAAWAFVNELTAPILSTRAASAITRTTATLNAVVDPEGVPVSDCHFEYGTTTHYGLSAPCSPAPGSAISTLPVSSAISSLSEGLTYHFRVVATNATGTSDGADLAFVTSAPPAPPTVGKLSTKKGPPSGATSIVITGANFTAASAVLFGASAASAFTVNSATSITATAPPGSAGVVDVRVSTAGGTSAITSKDRFAYGAPAVTALMPSTGAAAGGTSVSVTGAGFAPGSGTTSFKFGKALATSVTCTSSTSCTAVSPAGKSGTVDVTAIVGKAKGKKSPPGDHFSFG
jgi:hypothetical protein